MPKEKKVAHTLYLEKNTKILLQDSIKQLNAEGEDFITFCIYILSINGIIPPDFAKRIKDIKNKPVIEVLSNTSKPYTLVDALNINTETLDRIQKSLIDIKKENINLYETLIESN
jgi:hypothetical protein